MFDVIVGKEFSQKVIPLINQAQHTIMICVFDWRWYPNEPGNPVQQFNLALISATRRGVNVSVITNCRDIVATLKNQGINAKHFISSKILHTKLMIIDSTTVIIGSHNYTQSAFTMNQEVSCIITRPVEIERFIEYFNNVYSVYG